MHILIAPNSFKNSIDAEKAAKFIQNGLQESLLNATCQLFPIADGGDFTCEILVNFFEGKKRKILVQDPLGRQVEAEFGLIDQERTAVIEFAKASGLDLLKKEELDPLVTNSYGTGQILGKVAKEGVARVLFGLGGSATVDGGTGILRALGGKFKDRNGNEMVPVPGNIDEITTIELEGLLDPDLQMDVLCDVENPLLGELGAARVFGPQKGADPDQVKQLEYFLGKLNDLYIDHLGVDVGQVIHGGAAGGVAATLKAVFNAKLHSGIDFLLSLMDFEKLLDTTDLLITAEGRIDSQTISGKGPVGLAARAKERGLPVIALAGSVEAGLNAGRFFDAIFTIGSGPATLDEALENTASDLVRTSTQIGNLLAAKFISGPSG